MCAQIFSDFKISPWCMYPHIIESSFVNMPLPHCNGYTRIFFQKVRVFPHRARDLNHMSAFDALYMRRVRALLRFIVVVVVVRVVGASVGAFSRARRRRRAAHRVVDDRAHTHNPETVVVVVVSPRLAGLRHSRHTVVIAHRHSFIHCNHQVPLFVRWID